MTLAPPRSPYAPTHSADLDTIDQRARALIADVRALPFDALDHRPSGGLGTRRNIIVRLITHADELAASLGAPARLAPTVHAPPRELARDLDRSLGAVADRLRAREHSASPAIIATGDLLAWMTLTIENLDPTIDL